MLTSLRYLDTFAKIDGLDTQLPRLPYITRLDVFFLISTPFLSDQQSARFLFADRSFGDHYSR
jgi:hypothetical protein